MFFDAAVAQGHSECVFADISPSRPSSLDHCTFYLAIKWWHCLSLFPVFPRFSPLFPELSLNLQKVTASIPVSCHLHPEAQTLPLPGHTLLCQPSTSYWMLMTSLPIHTCCQHSFTGKWHQHSCTWILSPENREASPCLNSVLFSPRLPAHHPDPDHLGSGLLRFIWPPFKCLSPCCVLSSCTVLVSVPLPALLPFHRPVSGILTSYFALALDFQLLVCASLSPKSSRQQVLST